MNKLKLNFDKISTIIVCIIIALFILVVGSNKGYLFGYTARIVVTGSMEPAVKVNSVSIIKACDINDIQINDIICFNFSQDIIHRVVDVTKDKYDNVILYTKGDSNESPDDIEITNGMLIGKVIYTFNGLAPIIEKYSIEPGKINTKELSKSIIIYGIILIIIGYLLVHTIKYISYFIRVFRNKDNILENHINSYLNDIDELILYREILNKISETDTENKPKTRFEFICNKLSQTLTLIEIKELHSSINHFKKKSKESLEINKIGQYLDIKTNSDK